MPAPDYRDIIGGIFLVSIGIFSFIYSVYNLRIGSVAHMGPGMFPAALGFILSALGFAILIPAFFRRGSLPSIELRSFITILASVLAFALVLRPFGLVPAVVVLTLIASRADNRLSYTGAAVLAAVLALGANLIFRTAIGMPIAAFTWPW